MNMWGQEQVYKDWEISQEDIKNYTSNFPLFFHNYEFNRKGLARIIYCKVRQHIFDGQLEIHPVDFTAHIHDIKFNTYKELLNYVNSSS